MKCCLIPYAMGKSIQSTFALDYNLSLTFEYLEAIDSIESAKFVPRFDGEPICRVLEGVVEADASSEQKHPIGYRHESLFVH